MKPQFQFLVKIRKKYVLIENLNTTTVNTTTICHAYNDQQSLKSASFNLDICLIGKYTASPCFISSLLHIPLYRFKVRVRSEGFEMKLKDMKCVTRRTKCAVVLARYTKGVDKNLNLGKTDNIMATRRKDKEHFTKHKSFLKQCF